MHFTLKGICAGAHIPFSLFMEV